MKPGIRQGLIVGLIGGVLNICLAGFFGICGVVLALVVGGVAGYLAVQQEKPMVKNDGTRLGATAGAVAGGVVLVGQILGTIASLAIQSSADIQPIFGSLPAAGDTATQAVFYATGIGVGCCIGLVGVALAAGGGAAAGYIGTSESKAAF